MAFGGWQAKFDNIKVGYDTNDDDDLDDVGDDLVFSQDFSSTSDTFAYDDAGNLVKDGEFIYTYDAWHRLVTAVSAEDDDITVGTYTYDALARRIRKVVTNSGQLDGTELYFYGKGHQVIEVRDGSENMIRQVVHGRQYIDEVILEILEDGVAWVHQDANYNVIALTDFASQTLEHTYYTPYGIQTVDQETYWGDADGDGLVTETEWDTDTDGQLDSGDTCWGSSPSGSCRLVDFDFDNDVDATDATRLAELDSTTTYRHPGQPYSAVGNTRVHQGLMYDAEIGGYQNRARWYRPALKSFGQRDPLRYVDGLNLYEYVGGNPLRYRDPTGEGYCDRSDEDYEDDPGWAQDWPGISDLLHCGIGGIGMGKDAPCRCFRQVTPSGQSGGHVCFRPPPGGPPPAEGGKRTDCFDPHDDTYNCCVAKNSLGFCKFDICACVLHWWHDVLDMP